MAKNRNGNNLEEKEYHKLYRPPLRFSVDALTTPEIASLKTKLSLPDIAQANAGSSGYLDIGETRIQYGVSAGAAGGVDVTFPQPFANANYSITVTPGTEVVPSSSTDQRRLVTTSEKTNVKFRFTVRDSIDGFNSSLGVNWIAIGLKP